MDCLVEVGDWYYCCACSDLGERCVFLRSTTDTDFEPPTESDTIAPADEETYLALGANSHGEGSLDGLKAHKDRLVTLRDECDEGTEQIVQSIEEVIAITWQNEETIRRTKLSSMSG